MRVIFVGSTGSQPGQTLATWALAVKLKEKGLKVGFFKPYGSLGGVFPTPAGSPCDPDVLLMRDAIGFQEPDETICPITVSENLTPEPSGSSGKPLLEKIQESFQQVSAGKDVVVIMGGKEIFFGGGLSGLSDSALVKEFDASVLLVDRYQKDHLTLYSLLSLNSFLDGRVKSAIMNHIPPEKMDHVKGKLIPLLQEKGLQSIVPIPEDPILAAQTVYSIAGVAGGQILCCPEREENLVTTSTIGVKLLEGPLSIFKQVYNKIILIGLGPREPQEKNVAGIMLTGGKPPGEALLRVARDHSIPLILTSADTFQVMEKLEQGKPAMSKRDEFRVRQFLTLIDQESTADRWVEALL